MIDALPPLREVMEAYEINARKSLGQNFLCDLNLTAKIARSAGFLDDCDVLEIGAGPGGLTRAILAQGVRRPALRDIARVYPDKLEVIHGDALTIDAASFFQSEGRKVKIIANLPYNVGTQLLLGWLLVGHWPPFYQSMNLMFQREVALRIVATPGSSAYGRLSVLAGWRTHAHIVFDVPAQAFTPPPKVTSSIVQLIPRDNPLPVDLAKLEAITKAAFGQRRKMLRQSLKSLGGETLLEKANIDPTRRAETLNMTEFITLAHGV